MSDEEKEQWDVMLGNYYFAIEALIEIAHGNPCTCHAGCPRCDAIEALESLDEEITTEEYKKRQQEILDNIKKYHKAELEFHRDLNHFISNSNRKFKKSKSEEESNDER